jgi:hypothetical protein
MASACAGLQALAVEAPADADLGDDRAPEVARSGSTRWSSALEQLGLEVRTA